MCDRVRNQVLPELLPLAVSEELKLSQRVVAQRHCAVQTSGAAPLAVALIRLAGRWTSRHENRGLWRVCRTLAVLPGMTSSSAVVGLTDDTAFSFRLDDPYWTQLLASSYVYEPELEWLLSRLAQHRYLMLDCGANRGYWSALASSASFGSQFCVAVEASPVTYEWLVETWRLNDQRFAISNRAVSATHGEEVFVDKPVGKGDHAGIRTHAALDPSPQFDCVTTTNISELLQTFRADHHEFVLVKLDVEGAEVSAMAGSDLSVNTEVAIVYEDHGSDLEHRATRYLLDSTELKVYFLHPDGVVGPLVDADQLTRLKKSPKKGYNLVAIPMNLHEREPFASVIAAARTNQI